jgi:hypothetical protein
MIFFVSIFHLRRGGGGGSVTGPNQTMYFPCNVTVSVSFFKYFREKAELGGIAAVKIKELTAELQANGSKPFNPDERIRSGFIHFKTEKFEYVFAFTV